MAIKTVALDREPVASFGKLEKKGTVTKNQLSSLERSIRGRLNQNESRRNAGVEKAGQYFVR
ncbi:MAG: hypothetical protein IIT65_08745 [Lachnospiraceae bacterium]|nr:hypothetical protein [Lachnospiraceae bacterium]